ncbi:MAG TPA: glycosyltransferase family 9 protein [Fimbriiglobus sp.]|jgi:heptosyltransferase-2
MRTIALFLPNWIGDVVMATPAVRAVRKTFPRSRLLGVVKPYVSESLSGCPWFDRVIPFDRSAATGPGFWSTARTLRAERADAAVLFPNTFRSALLARFGGCRRVIGFARYGRDFLLSDRLYPVRDGSGQPKPTPVIGDYNRLVETLGTPAPGHDTQLFTTPRDEAAADDAWAVLGLGRYRQAVGLNPGGAFGASKHWPTEHFAELARTFAEQGFGVLVLCGPSERAEADTIAAKAGHPAVVSLGIAPLSIGLTKACVRRLALLVTTDSGPRHFAPAFGVPVVTMFGPTHIAWTETYQRAAIHLQIPVDCGPCQKRICPLGHHRCMTELLPAAVAAAGRDLLIREAGRVAEPAPAAA